MRLDEVISGIAITDRRGRLDCTVTGITPDSRAVHPGHMFVAVRGLSADGHEYVRQAVDAGASSILAETWDKNLDKELGTRTQVVLVPNSRRALALAAANYFGQPSRRLLIAGVTGTNGKTTVTYILESIMRAASRKVGVIGTVGARYGEQKIEATHTTPDAVRLQETLARMVGSGVTHVVMEVSSHALDQQRVCGINFKVAGFTNLTQDHLDYHKTIDTYFKAKSRLFSQALRKSKARGRMAVVNVDDPRGDELLEIWGGKSLRTSIDPSSDADVVALQASCALNGTELTVRTPKGVWELRYPLIGNHNVSNVLVAMGMALAMGFSRARIERGLRALEKVDGRGERVANADGKNVFVDYAHTPDALRRLLEAFRPLTRGRLVVVFGCGGDRDRDKRPKMGEAVAERADVAVITNDNPRSEDAVHIAAAVEEGLKSGGFTKMDAEAKKGTYLIELDRRAAIRAAIKWLGEDDVLIIAGKGHERYQIIGRSKQVFDDAEEARLALAGLPPPLPEMLAFDDATGEVDEDQVLSELDDMDSVSDSDVESIDSSDVEMVLAADVSDFSSSDAVPVSTAEVEAIEEISPADVEEITTAEVEAISAEEIDAADVEEVSADDVQEITAEVADPAEVGSIPPPPPASVPAEGAMAASSDAEADADVKADAGGNGAGGPVIAAPADSGAAPTSSAVSSDGAASSDGAEASSAASSDGAEASSAVSSDGADASSAVSSDGAEASSAASSDGAEASSAASSDGADASSASAEASDATGDSASAEASDATGDSASASSATGDSAEASSADASSGTGDSASASSAEANSATGDSGDSSTSASSDNAEASSATSESGDSSTSASSDSADAADAVAASTSGASDDDTATKPATGAAAEPSTDSGGDPPAKDPET